MESKKAVALEFMSGQDQNYRLRESLVVIFCLSGQMTIETTDGTFQICAEGIAVVNPLTPYRGVCEDGAYAICLQLGNEILEQSDWNGARAIACHIPGMDDQTEPANEVRTLLSRLVQDYFRNEDARHPKALAQNAAALVKKLLERYAGKASGTAVKTETKQLLARVLQTIQEKYSDPALTIQAVSDAEFISVSHLSRLFQTVLHSTFTKYLIAVRLEHALSQLQDSRNSITFIAVENGFKSVNSFIEYFHRQFGDTPGQYHKKAARTAETNSIDLQPLLKYYVWEPDEAHSETIRAAVDVTQAGQPLYRNWNKILNIGYAREAMTAVVQNQVVQAQKEIGFEFLRMHGIFDDEMHIYQENDDGSPWYNFLYADILLDFVLEAGLKPYIELGYMPSKLANSDYRIFDKASLFSLYNDSSKWIALVQASIAHWIERYGLKDVCQWRFSMIGLHCVYTDEIPICAEEYYEWYYHTYFAIKEICPALLFGGPSFMSNLEYWPKRVSEFLEFTKQNNCVPDFFCAQCRPHDSSKMDDKNFIALQRSQDTMPATLSGDIDYTRHFVTQCRAMLAQCQLEHIPVLLDEWNSTLWQRDLSGDTCYKSAWLVKNCLENTSSPTMFGYYLLTDFIEEWMTKNNTVFHGGYGLFTVNNIPKSGYLAMRMLNRARGRKIAGGRGWCVTKDSADQSIQIFLYHYCHYSGLYRRQYQRIKNPEDAYHVFEENGDLHIHLALEGMKLGSFREERYEINREHGSAFDKWIQMGAPEILRRQDIEYLSAGAQPLSTIQDFVNTHPIIEINETLKPHEVKLIILQYQQY